MLGAARSPGLADAVGPGTLKSPHPRHRHYPDEDDLIASWTGDIVSLAIRLAATTTPSGAHPATPQTRPHPRPRPTPPPRTAHSDGVDTTTQ